MAENPGTDKVEDLLKSVHDGFYEKQRGLDF